MPLYRDTYRTESARHPTWDYRSPGWYFITICTHQHIQFFGTIRNGIMGLSVAGCVAHRNWAAIPTHFDHVRLDTFVIMPDHVHGLLGITSVPDDSVETLESNVSAGGRDKAVDDSVSRHMSRISPMPDPYPPSSDRINPPVPNASGGPGAPILNGSPGVMIASYATNANSTPSAGIS